MTTARLWFQQGSNAKCHVCHQTMYSRNSETSRSSMGASSILGFEMPKGVATTSRTAAYGRAVFAWAVKRGAVRTNPFPDLPVAKGVGKRERVLSDQEIAEIWRAAGDAAWPYYLRADAADVSARLRERGWAPYRLR